MTVCYCPCFAVASCQKMGASDMGVSDLSSGVSHRLFNCTCLSRIGVSHLLSGSMGVRERPSGIGVSHFLSASKGHACVPASRADLTELCCERGLAQERGVEVRRGGARAENGACTSGAWLGVALRDGARAEKGMLGRSSGEGLRPGETTWRGAAAPEILVHCSRKRCFALRDLYWKLRPVSFLRRAMSCLATSSSGMGLSSTPGPAFGRRPEFQTRSASQGTCRVRRTRWMVFPSDSRRGQVSSWVVLGRQVSFFFTSNLGVSKGELEKTEDVVSQWPGLSSGPKMMLLRSVDMLLLRCGVPRAR